MKFFVSICVLCFFISLPANAIPLLEKTNLTLKPSLIEHQPPNFNIRKQLETLSIQLKTEIYKLSLIELLIYQITSLLLVINLFYSTNNK